MKTFKFQLRFNTPTFLGNAEQSGQWRTPPIKAQLRQWWRVAYAAKHNFNVKETLNYSPRNQSQGAVFGVSCEIGHILA